jgi:CheY-like chemotaxis protein
MIRQILLVEDNDWDLELTIEGLKAGGLANELAVARDGVEALDYLLRRGNYAGRRGGMPALVLLDLKMPKVDGFQVLEEIRRHDALAAMPVVVMTSSQEPPDLARAYKLGCNAYVVKPVKYKEFIDAIKTTGLFWAVVNEPHPAVAGSEPVSPVA